jgi:hypothetical protein
MWGFDRTTYADATRRWLATGSFYNPWQLGGPYPLHYRDILYPPIALLVLVPAMALPPLLWWLIPLAIYGAVIAYHRPAWWAWPLIAWCICWPVSLLVIGNGNPGIWAAAAVALGTLAGWPAVMVLIKPTLAPVRPDRGAAAFVVARARRARPPRAAVRGSVARLAPRRHRRPQRPDGPALLARRGALAGGADHRLAGPD